MYYVVEVLLGFGTGAPQHRHGGGSGKAMSKSIKRARKHAMMLALHEAGEAAAWTPVLQEVKVTRNGNIIHHSF